MLLQGRHCKRGCWILHESKTNIQKGLNDLAWLDVQRWVGDERNIYWWQGKARFYYILSLTWVIEDDMIGFNKQKWSHAIPNLTKRVVLKQIASMYDPLGLFSPVTLQGKIFLQALWNKKLAWDESLPVKTGFAPGFFFFRHQFRQFDFFDANFFKFGPFIASHINLMMKVISCNLSTWGCFIDF